MNLLRSCVVSIAVLVVCTTFVFSQTNEMGAKPFGSFQGGDVDQINILNGHLELRIPLLDYPQRGGRLHLTFIARFHNAVWNELTDCVPTASICVHRWEFDGPPGVAVATEDAPPTVSQHLVSGGNTQSPNYAYSVGLADESQHPLGNIAGSIYESLDATAIKWDSSTATVTLPNGSRYTGIFSGSPVLEDTNGNQVFFNYGTPGNIIDTLGRAIPWSGSSGSTTDFTGCTGALPISSASLWVVPGSNGSQNTYKLCYAQVHIYTGHYAGRQNTSAQQYIEINADYSVLQSIVLPDNTAWTFDYSQPNAQGINWGDLLKVTFPTGGSISYSWAHGQGCHVLFGPAGSWSGTVVERDVDANDGLGVHAWHYHAGSLAGERVVADPLGNDTVHTFTDLNSSCSVYETSTQYFKGSETAGTLLKTEKTDYSFTATIASTVPPTNVVLQRKTTIWPNGVQKKTEYAYDSGFTYGNLADGTQSPGIYGMQTSVNEFDYGQGAPGPLLKSTQTTYLWQSPAGAQYIAQNVLDVPNSVAIYDGSGNRVALTNTAYDEATPSASGISNAHDVNPINGNVRGNATSVSHWLNGSATATAACAVSVSNGFVTEKKTYLDTGMVSQITDVCNHNSTFQYASAAPYFGAYVTQSCDALNHCSNMTYNSNPGLIASTTDPNQQVTTYSYDDLGRPKSVVYPDTGETDFFYPDANTIEKKQVQDRAADSWIDQYSYFDGLGRLHQTRLVDPEGDVYGEKSYDSLGRVSSVTNAHRQTASATDGSTMTEYDALGRPVTVTLPDSNLLQTTYSDPDTLTRTDETGRQRKERRDALGRLVQLDEPGDSFAGAKASGSVNIIGTLQSTTYGGSPAQKATGWITISGNEKSVTYPGDRYCADFAETRCVDWETLPPTTVNDSGTVKLYVNGQQFFYPYGANDSVSTIANWVGGSIRANSTSTDYSNIIVNTTATPPTATIYLIAKNTGIAGNNITLSFDPTTWDTTDFASASFNPSISAATLTGGANAVAGTPVYDSGTVSLSVGGFGATVNYGSGAGLDGSASAVAGDLAGKINAQLPATNPPFSIQAVPNTGQININWNSVGTVVVTTTSSGTQTAYFAQPSFASCTITVNPQSCSTTLPGGADPFPSGIAHPFSTFYSYDVLNNLTRVEQHGDTTDSTQWRIRTFSYDSLSRLTQSNNPEAGQLSFTYDAAGNNITRSDARGITITNTFDVLNRLTKRQYSDGSTPREFYYDTTPGLAYNAPNHGSSIGRLTHASNDVNSAYDPIYDPMGRVIGQVYCLPSNCNYTVSATATYDLAGHLKTLTYPSGRLITNSYNGAGQPINVQLNGVSTRTWNVPYYTVPQSTTPSTWGFNPDGSLHMGTFGNGVTEAYGYNDRLQLNSISASSSAQTWLNKQYGLYDPSGHDNGQIYTISDALNSGRNQTYSYDSLGRVISGSQQDGSFNQTFSYDSWGNMKMSGTNIFTPSYDGKNRILGAPTGCAASTAYCYDSAGNLLNDGLHQYSYDAENRIRAVDSTGATYTYGPQGERVRKDTGGSGTEYIDFAGLPIAEEDVNTGNWSDYIYFAGKRIARATNFEHQLHVGGVMCSSCGSQWYQFQLTNLGQLAGRVVHAGDALRWLQWQNSGSTGGIVISFTDGTDTRSLGIRDQNGEMLSASSMINQWDYRIASLSSVAGKTISQVRLYTDGATAAGQWDLYFQDLVFTGGESTIIPLFSQNATAPGMTGSGTAGVTSTVANIHDCVGTGCSPVNTTMYFHDDQIGSARLLSAGYGYPVWQGTFTPFGQEVSPEITTNHFKFSGKERGEAAEGGLDYFGARYYSSTMGRWMTPDWSAAPTAVPYANYTNPQSLNLYGYVTDDPLSHTDIDGHALYAPRPLIADEEEDSCGKYDVFCHLERYGRLLEQQQKARKTRQQREWLLKLCTDDECRRAIQNLTPELVDVLYRAKHDNDAHAIMQLLAAAGPMFRPKPPNLPSWKKLKIDWNEIESGHVEGGSRLQQSRAAGANKDVFPEGMDRTQIERAMKEAYTNGKNVQSQGDRVLVQGSGGGMTIQMWVNRATNFIESAWPKW